jgi:hypothetical protein
VSCSGDGPLGYANASGSGRPWSPLTAALALASSTGEELLLRRALHGSG